MRRTTRITAALVAAGLLATGCSGASDGETGGAVSGVDTAVGAPVGAAEPDDGGVAEESAGDRGGTSEAGAALGSDGEAPATIHISSPLGRQVVFNARLSLEVDDTAATVEAIRRSVEQAGGFVAGADLHRVGEGGLLAGSMTLRVPADRLSTTLAALKDMASEVVDEGLDSDDVTEEYADVQAQLRNLRALETELLALLADIRERSNDATQVLTVFERIRQVRGEIEQLEGRRQVLDDLVSLATIQVELQPTPTAAPIATDEWRPGEVARDALRSTVNALRGVVDGAIWVALTLLPLLVLVLGLPLAVALGVRRTLRRRTARPADPSPTAG